MIFRNFCNSISNILLSYSIEPFQEQTRIIDGKEVDQLFRKTPPMFYNIIDADAAHQKITKFTQPSFLSSTSLGHIHSKSLPAAYRPNKESNFLLISQDGNVTMFHQDFSSTSVLYILLKGCKTFFLIAPTSINQDLFNQFLQQPRRKFFFGSHEGLNMGGCQAITLKARQGLIMPANMIHMVETTGVSVAYGVNFIFKNHLRLAADTFKTERVQKTKFTECYPSFSFLALTHIVSRVQ